MKNGRKFRIANCEFAISTLKLREFADRKGQAVNRHTPPESRDCGARFQFSFFKLLTTDFPLFVQSLELARNPSLVTGVY
jgi:hypothetical protein